jgi:CheY-like chemotaxis protein
MPKPVLVVDDQQQSLRELTAGLQAHGYAPASPAAGEDPALRFTLMQAELVFISLGYPHAIDVCGSIRADPDGAIVPIIFVGAGHLEVQSPSDALAKGADFFFALPLDIGRVLAKVQTYLGRGEAVTTPATAPTLPTLPAWPTLPTSPTAAAAPSSAEKPIAAAAPAAAQESGASSLARPADVLLRMIEEQEAEREAEQTRSDSPLDAPAATPAAAQPSEEQLRREIEERVRSESEERIRREVEARVQREAEEKAQREAEEKAQREAKEKAQREAKEKAQREAKEKAQREAEEKARREAEEKARREAEERMRRDAEEKVRREAEDRTRLEAELRQQSEEALRHRIEEEVRRRIETEAASAPRNAAASRASPSSTPPRATASPPALSPTRTAAPGAPAEPSARPNGNAPPAKALEPGAGAVDGTFDMADLCFAAFSQQVTGRLDVTSQGRQRALFLERGGVVDAYSSQVCDRIEEYLLREGKITRAQYQEVRLRALRGARKVGAFLVGEGHLKPQELFTTVRGHLKDVVFGLFEWEEGSYRYSTEVASEEDRVALDEELPVLATEGIRRKYLLERLMSRLGGPSSLVGLIAEAAIPLDLLGLSDDERRVMRLVDGTRSIEDLVFGTELEPLSVYQVLAAAVAAGSAKVLVRGLETSPKDSAGSDAVDRNRIMDKLEQARQVDYFQMLGLPRQATPYEIEHALARHEREFAASRFSSTLHDQLREELTEINAVLAEARLVLSDEALRQAYAAHLPN